MKKFESWGSKVVEVKILDGGVIKIIDYLFIICYYGVIRQKKIENERVLKILNFVCLLLKEGAVKGEVVISGGRIQVIDYLLLH